jgi:hypothetical protein
MLESIGQETNGLLSSPTKNNQPNNADSLGECNEQSSNEFGDVWKVYDEAPHVPDFESLNLLASDLAYVFNNLSRFSDIMTSHFFMKFPPLVNNIEAHTTNNIEYQTNEEDSESAVHILLQSLDAKWI